MFEEEAIGKVENERKRVDTMVDTTLLTLGSKSARFARTSTFLALAQESVNHMSFIVHK